VAEILALLLPPRDEPVVAGRQPDLLTAGRARLALIPSSRPASTPKRDAADADAGDLYLDARLMMSARPYDWLNQPMFLLLQM
jgi:hypothetical protein